MHAIRAGLITFGFGLLLSLLIIFAVHATDRGQYAQVDPGTRDWFTRQTSPKTGMSCCSQADGTEAEEDIRDGHYWTRWHDHPEWMQVPDDVILPSNHQGAPIVWWYMDYSGGDGGQIKIRCYARGSGA